MITIARWFFKKYKKYYLIPLNILSFFLDSIQNFRVEQAKNINVDVLLNKFSQLQFSMSLIVRNIFLDRLLPNIFQD